MESGWYPLYTTKILASPVGIAGHHWTPPNNLKEGYWVGIAPGGAICHRDVSFTAADIATFNIYRLV